MRLPKNLLNPQTYVKPRIFLCQTDKEKICTLNTTGTSASFKLNAFSELNFEVGRIYNDDLNGQTLVNPFYDLIEAPRLILVEGFGYFEIQSVELISDGIKEIKNITANSLEYNLSTKYLEDFYINQGTVESQEVLNADDPSNIVPITLYNKTKPKLSLLHLILEKSNGYWNIGHVDTQLQTMSRQFDIDRISIYDFIMNEMCKKFNCYAVFDTINNLINIYAESPTAKFKGDGKTTTFTIGGATSAPFSSVETVAIDGYKTTKWSYGIVDGIGVLVLEEAPVDGAYIEVVGVDATWETDVMVSFDNLVQEANVSYNIDDIRTVLTITYGDDIDIREANLGLPYITDLSFFHTVEWMGQDLYDAYGAYLDKSNSFQTEYNNNAKEILVWNDKISYEENRLSLQYSVASVGPTTVGEYYIKQTNMDGSFYYSTVSLPSDYKVDTTYYSNLTTNVDEEKVGSLCSALKSYACGYFNSDKDLVSNSLNAIIELSEEFKFVTEYTINDFVASLRNAKSETQIESYVQRFLEELWSELGRTPLIKLYLEPYKKVDESGVDAGWSIKGNDNYGSYYMTVVFIDSINKAIAERDGKISGHKEKQSVYVERNKAIGDELLMDNNFTDTQLIRLNAFLREDELHLDDFVETDLDDLSSSMTLKQDAMESGRIELKKMCQPQLQFSMSMANIYALSEFEPIVDQFQLGNIIRVCIRRDYIKQSRLLQVDINFDDFSDFSCEFGELTNLRTQSDIHADLLSNAITAGKSVATYSSYWSRGSDTASAVEKLIQNGLLDSTTAIKAIDGTQGVVIDKYGIKLQKVDPSTGTIDPKQGWIVNNQFLFSDDGFKSSRAVFGEYDFDGQTYYGILAEALVGQLLIGSDLKISNNSGTLHFDDNGLNISNKTSVFKVVPNSDNLLSVTSNEEEVLYLDKSGNLNITGVINATGGNIGGCEITDGVLKIANANISEKLTADQIDATNLRVDVANIDGELTANSIEVKDEYGNKLFVAKDNAVTLSGWTASAPALIAPDYSMVLCSDDFGLVLPIAGSEHKGDWRIMAGGSTPGDYTFGVDKDGNVYASSVNLTGIINATGGNIGGCTFDDDGKLIVDVAHINGKLTAEQIDATNLSVNAAKISGQLTAAQINTEGLIAENISATTIDGKTITGGSIFIGDAEGDHAEITSNGILKCSGAEIDGTVHLKNGSSIGAFSTDNNSIFSGSWGASGTTPPTVFMCSGSGNSYSIGGSERISGWAFGSGTTFGVTNDGAMYTSKGKIGGWDIDESAISSIVSIDGADGDSYLMVGLNKLSESNIDNQKILYSCVYDSVTMDEPIYPFYIDGRGGLHSTSADISGGNIGGWDIKGTGLFSEGNSTWIQSNGTFTFTPKDNGVVNPNIWCSFRQNGNGGYNFILGEDCIFQFGDKILKKADFDKLLGLIGTQAASIDEGDIYE